MSERLAAAARSRSVARFAAGHHWTLTDCSVAAAAAVAASHAAGHC